MKIDRSSIVPENYVNQVRSQIKSGGSSLLCCPDTVKITHVSRYIQKRLQLSKGTVRTFSSLPHKYRPIVGCEFLKNYLFINRNMGKSTDILEDNDRAASFRVECTKQIKKKLIAKEQSDWTVVIDESGDFNDNFQEKDSRSVLIAVLVPPGESLPAVWTGYHSVESSLEKTEALYRNLLQSNAIVMAFPFHQADTCELKGNDIHEQFWRHALRVILEYIASSGNPGKNVNLYLEQVGPLHAGSRVLQGFINDLLETMSHTHEWGQLSINHPMIIRKDEHPFLAYADCLGPVFRPRQNSKLNPNIMKEIERRSVQIPYVQKSMQAFANIVRQSALQPVAALHALLRLTPGQVKQLAPLLEGVSRRCVEHLPTDSLVNFIEGLEKLSFEKEKQGPVVDLIIKALEHKSLSGSAFILYKQVCLNRSLQKKNLSKASAIIGELQEQIQKTPRPLYIDNLQGSQLFYFFLNDQASAVKSLWQQYLPMALEVQSYEFKPSRLLELAWRAFVIDGYSEEAETCYSHLRAFMGTSAEIRFKKFNEIK